MGKPQRRFGKEFEAEAVRLVEVSGRTASPTRRDNAMRSHHWNKRAWHIPKSNLP